MSSTINTRRSSGTRASVVAHVTLPVRRKESWLHAGARANGPRAASVANHARRTMLGPQTPFVVRIHIRTVTGARGGNISHVNDKMRSFRDPRPGWQGSLRPVPDASVRSVFADVAEIHAERAELAVEVGAFHA